MDREVVAVLLSFALYGLYVLLPIIPATLIYRWFPNSAVTATGTLSNFKINSSGAFAAYIVTVLLGYFLISSTQEKIVQLESRVAPTWTLNGVIELRDQNGNTVTQTSLLRQVDVSVKPEIFTSANGNIHLKLPGTESGSWPQLLVSLNVLGFGSETINLTMLDHYEVKVDNTNKVISFLKPIVVKTINEPGQGYDVAQSYLNAPGAAGGGQ
jgi:hypothetical protein